jgi:hypothetical protein
MKQIFAVLCVLAIAVSAQAEKKKGLLQQMEGQGYGMAGCGLGSIVFGDDPGVGAQLGAAVVNDIIFPQTFAISSGISNCGHPDGQTAIETDFIKANKVALQNESVRGQGETIQTLSNLMGCQNQNFGSDLQKNYKTIFATDSVDTIKTEVAKHCKIAG